jgi:hypothetical protein
MTALVPVPNQDDDNLDENHNPRDFNRLVEDLGEESAKVELLRR